VVHKPNGQTLDFIQSDAGLFYFDTKEEDKGMMLVNTIVDNKSKYSNANYSHASLAHKLQITIVWPSTADFMHIVKNKLIPNCPITSRDIIAADDIAIWARHSLTQR
jgi:hypothetical protein